MKKYLKLVKLLKEYEEWKVGKYWLWNYIWQLDKDLWIIFAKRFPGMDLITEDESRAIIISKGYNFIKWLVDNDRIDFEKDKYWIILYENWVQKFLKSEEEILMELSIQESPIEYLISILKKNDRKLNK